ncbi:MAG: hypothetical protein C4516_10555 [Oxalobacter sp.]|jgi:hypothetical protein|nr:MAG: hypothetical protein C4516_10555 [Oxalobacter sp.]
MKVHILKQAVPVAPVKVIIKLMVSTDVPRTSINAKRDAGVKGMTACRKIVAETAAVAATVRGKGKEGAAVGNRVLS